MRVWLFILCAGRVGYRKIKATDTPHATYQKQSNLRQMAGKYVVFYKATFDGGATKSGALYFYPGETPFLSRSIRYGRCAFYDIESGTLFFVADDNGKVYALDSRNAALAPLYWRSKEFHLPVPENFGAIRFDVDGSIDREARDNLNTEVAAIIAANTAIIAVGSVDGALGSNCMNAVAFNGSTLTPIPGTQQPAAVTVIADGRRVFQVTTPNQPKRLPSGFKAEVWEVEVSGTDTVTQIVLGRTMQDLQSTP